MEVRDAQRVGRAPGSGQRPHQEGVRGVGHRVAGGVRFEEGEGRDGLIGLDQVIRNLLDGRRPERLELGGVGDRPWFATELVECIAVPPPQTLDEAGPTIGDESVGRDERGEPNGVDVDVEEVPGRRRLEGRTHDSPQPGDDLAQRTPSNVERLSERVGADRVSRLEGQDREQSALRHTRRFEHAAVGFDDGDRAEQPDLDGLTGRG